MTISLLRFSPYTGLKFVSESHTKSRPLHTMFLTHPNPTIYLVSSVFNQHETPDLPDSSPYTLRQSPPVEPFSTGHSVTLHPSSGIPYQQNCDYLNVLIHQDSIFYQNPPSWPSSRLICSLNHIQTKANTYPHHHITQCRILLTQ